MVHAPAYGFHPRMNATVPCIKGTIIGLSIFSCLFGLANCIAAATRASTSPVYVPMALFGSFMFVIGIIGVLSATFEDIKLLIAFMALTAGNGVAMLASTAALLATRTEPTVIPLSVLSGLCVLFSVINFYLVYYFIKAVKERKLTRGVRGGSGSSMTANYSFQGNITKGSRTTKK